MNNSLDRDLFEKFLESACVVTQSGMTSRSLTVIMEVQRFMNSDEATLAASMRFVLERLAIVADADGAAIALVRANQLVYQATIGTAAGCEKKSLAAVLCVANRSGRRCEIVRVEDAENDPRVEAEICRQFGSKAFLLLPIFRDHTVIGVLDIRFDQKHIFENQELRVYHHMTGFIEEALRGAECGSQNEVERQPAAPSATTINRCRTEHADSAIGTETRNQSVDAAGMFERGSGRKPAPRRPSHEGVATFHSLHRPNFPRLIVVSAIVSILIAQAWVAYELHRTATDTASKLSTPKVARKVRSPFVPIPGISAMRVPASARRAEPLDRGGFMRVQVGQTEIDYVADDVTIREFKTLAAPVRTAGLSQEFNIGDDVTVRLIKPTSGHVP